MINIVECMVWTVYAVRRSTNAVMQQDMNIIAVTHVTTLAQLQCIPAYVIPWNVGVLFKLLLVKLSLGV